MDRDGVLRRVSASTWEGTLNGYRVLVSDSPGGDWFAHVINPRGWCLAMRRGTTFRAAARLAREWVEANPLP
jgi:hypothetical protein